MWRFDRCGDSIDVEIRSMWRCDRCGDSIDVEIRSMWRFDRGGDAIDVEIARRAPPHLIHEDMGNGREEGIRLQHPQQHARRAKEQARLGTLP